MNEWMNEWMNELMNERMNKRTNERTNEWMIGMIGSSSLGFKRSYFCLLLNYWKERSSWIYELLNNFLFILGNMGDSLKTKTSVFLSADAGLSWHQVRRVPGERLLHVSWYFCFQIYEIHMQTYCVLPNLDPSGNPFVEVKFGTPFSNGSVCSNSDQYFCKGSVLNLHFIYLLIIMTWDPSKKCSYLKYLAYFKNSRF